VPILDDEDEFDPDALGDIDEDGPPEEPDEER
jgi:hypothetical protein